MTSTKPLYVLRGILRNLRTELPKGLAPESSTKINGTRAFVLEQYRTSQHLSCPEEVARLRKLASDYLALQTDLKERERLYELDTGAETVLSPKEMSRRAAARAGLELPDLNPDLDK